MEMTKEDKVRTRRYNKLAEKFRNGTYDGYYYRMNGASRQIIVFTKNGKNKTCVNVTGLREILPEISQPPVFLSF